MFRPTLNHLISPLRTLRGGARSGTQRRFYQLENERNVPPIPPGGRPSFQPPKNRVLLGVVLGTAASYYYPRYRPSFLPSHGLQDTERAVVSALAFRGFNLSMSFLPFLAWTVLIQGFLWPLSEAFSTAASVSRQAMANASDYDTTNTDVREEYLSLSRLEAEGGGVRSDLPAPVKNMLEIAESDDFKKLFLKANLVTQTAYTLLKHPNAPWLSSSGSLSVTVFGVWLEKQIPVALGCEKVSGPPRPLYRADTLEVTPFCPLATLPHPSSKSSLKEGEYEQVLRFLTSLKSASSNPEDVRPADLHRVVCRHFLAQGCDRLNSRLWFEYLTFEEGG
eukprot:CAMPEP_0197546300 /NCGR_PEP_ID=MMETSP1320-20131121/958_1 /TAXON_ID=91990 /ORGANISM="Bolidomonas sp., Strain RCC2347" /LENGTH=334 /DNA_ID=CAMNT_0043105851 /DNA_START=104 /DNA_END=1105 /DNA_ORIENTATION=+